MMGNFLSAPSYVADSELSPEKINGIIFPPEVSLNVAAPVATQPEHCL